MTHNGHVIFVDDDRDVRDAIGQSLDLAGYEVTVCRALIEAKDHITPGFPGIVLTDIRMPGKDGFALMERALATDKDLPVIILTGEGDVPMAVRALTEGAYDFLEKPCPPKRLIAAVSRAMEKRRLILENRRLAAERTAVAHVHDTAPQAGLSVQMEMVEKLLIEAALRDHSGHVATVAQVLNLPRKTLYDKLKRHRIDPATFRDSLE